MRDERGMSRRQILVAGSGLALAGPSAFARGLLSSGVPHTTLITEPYVTVETAHGKIRGGQCRGALGFKGIPYGGSVSGDTRFKPAPPVEPWTGVRDALALGTPSAQSPKTVYGEHEAAPGEDCLLLNVWTPATDSKRRPVLFYNHGGGFMTGSAGSTGQDGGQLAANHDVVVVASNHRLGLLGYLYLDDPAYEGSGNAGMLDILAALRWVHENIAAFGGDPHNVTVFGESGGGAKTCCLMAMPAAHGLFHKAGIMSGPMLRVTPKEQAVAATAEILKALDIPASNLGRLADVPLARILEVQNGRNFGPMLDGKVVSQHPFDPAPAPFAAHVPVLIGNNRDEATFFFWQNPEVFKMDQAAMEARVRREMGDRASLALETFRRERPNATPVELYIAMSTAGMWGEGIEIAERKVAQHGAPVYMYRFDYESNYPIKDTDWTLRAGHATEIAAKFENGDLGGLLGTKPDRFVAAKNFGEVWASFARTGHPHMPGVDRWPAYDLSIRATGLVDVTCNVENDPHKAERELFETKFEH